MSRLFAEFLKLDFIRKTQHSWEWLLEHGLIFHDDETFLCNNWSEASDISLVYIRIICGEPFSTAVRIHLTKFFTSPEELAVITWCGNPTIMRPHPDLPTELLQSEMQEIVKILEIEAAEARKYWKKIN